MTNSGQPTRGWLIAVVLGAALGAACGRGPAPPVPATATPTPEILADCFWSTDVLAWVDADANGRRDAGEQPLSGVEVNFSLTFFSGAATGADGRAHLSGMHPGECGPAGANSVVALAPAGYAPTTDLVVAYTEARDLYEFGFRPGP